MVQNNAIYLVPISLREANEFLEQHGSLHKPMRGCTFCVGCALDGKLMGAAIVGRCREDSQAVQIDRICATGGRAAYGMLYGAAARAAQALGYWRIIAFLRSDRPDSALRAAGWARADPVEGGGTRPPNILRYERRLMTRRRWRG